jgi:hypothetical protein
MAPNKARRVRAALEAGFGKLLESSGGNGRENAGPTICGESVNLSQSVAGGNRREVSQPL